MVWKDIIEVIIVLDIIEEVDNLESFAQEVIDNWSYKFWVIKKIDSIKCKCVDKTSKEPSSTCKLCLGLGCKIKIYRVTGASRETREFESLRAEFPTVTPKIFYIKNKLYIDKQDLIFDEENLYSVYALQFHRGLNGKFKFTRCICPILKMNNGAIIHNLKEVLNENKHKH